MSNKNLFQAASSSIIDELIKEEINKLNYDAKIEHTGKVISVSDDILIISGLIHISFGDGILIKDKYYGLTLSLESDYILAICLEKGDIKAGDSVTSLNSPITMPVGYEFLGRIINPLGQVLDNGGDINCDKMPCYVVDTPGPMMMDRLRVQEPLFTGNKIIDTMIPIGKGQRELIIGDSKTGKTQTALDAIIHQKDQNIKCIYCSIGNKQSDVVKVDQYLQEHGAKEYTAIVHASASDTIAMHYLAPYSACSLAEFFMRQGEDVLIIYDDLTKHAWAHRQISLLIKRNPGRESYPGDIFFLHSRLLERATSVSAEYVERMSGVTNKTGSITALPILETQSGDLTAFIPTNIVSITDGQIFLDQNMFNSGIRPAISVGTSVSRVGGAAQSKLIRSLSKGARLSLAQYAELESFTQLSSEIEPETKIKLDRGKATIEAFKQKPFETVNQANLAIILLALNNGYLDNKSAHFIITWNKYIKTCLSQESFYEDILGKEAILTDKLQDLMIDFIEKSLETISI